MKILIGSWVEVRDYGDQPMAMKCQEIVISPVASVEISLNKAGDISNRSAAGYATIARFAVRGLAIRRVCDLDPLINKDPVSITMQRAKGGTACLIAVGTVISVVPSQGYRDHGFRVAIPVTAIAFPFAGVVPRSLHKEDASIDLFGVERRNAYPANVSDALVECFHGGVALQRYSKCQGDAEEEDDEHREA
ncbi:hypothetical protein MSAN_01885200 [Mycena sanguinolenta]|uniref:Uncharacterized protein n=1 Tax=Mycena sanguinolenta TaxID=230812 RepID=A0A8H7CSK3_9AGAR|nr:hypothetical protein MSAN_01885200 [Mycena sanguinolenta]